MRIIKAPKREEIKNDEICIFLAGSIEMGAAEQRVEKSFEGAKNVVLLNPRRDDWDSSWVQSIKNDQFVEQVCWELDSLDMADIVLLYFDPKTKSPISLLELGLYAPTKEHLIVCCPEGFWRKGNVDIVCAKHDVICVETLDALLVEANKRVWLLENINRLYKEL